MVAGPGKIDGRHRTRLAPHDVADIAASFQEAVIDCLVGKGGAGIEEEPATGHSASAAAWRRTNGSASGWKNRRLSNGYELHVPPFSLCTDNAVMGAIAVERLKAGKVEDLSLDILPGLERELACRNKARLLRLLSARALKKRPEVCLRAALCASSYSTWCVPALTSSWRFRWQLGQ